MIDIHSELMLELYLVAIVTVNILYFEKRLLGNSVAEWLERLLKVLEIDGSSLLKASKSCDRLNSPYA